MTEKPSNKRKRQSNNLDTKKPQTISIDPEVNQFIKVTAHHYGRDFQTVLNLTLKAGMRSLINQMISAEELGELSSKRSIVLETFENRLAKSGLIVP